MIIKTITCHECYNFGASLQAYALQTYLESLGHNVEIIHYKPDYLSGHFNLWSYHSGVNYPIVRELYIFAKLPWRLLALRRKRAFDNFTSEYLHLTKRYNSYSELVNEPPTADCYIAGSDQIWNTLFPNGRDKAFYLDFGNNSTKRISYAASFATSSVFLDCRDFVRQELVNFDCISVRERTALAILKDIGISDGVAVCDPVFLLPREMWESFLPPKSASTPYIFVYLTDKSLKIENIARKIASEKKWKIYAMGVRAKFADKNFMSASPFDFVNFVRNAEFVISNSFHATAFAIIFERNFCVVNRREDINERMKSLLGDIGLSERMADSFNDGLFNRIDYISVNKLQSEIVDFSKTWINQVLAK